MVNIYLCRSYILVNLFDIFNILAQKGQFGALCAFDGFPVVR